MRRIEALIVVGAGLFLALVLVTFRAPTRREVLLRPAPEFRLPALTGDSLALAERRGQTLLVNFWATWCPPCVEETPALVRLAEELGPRGLVVLGISVDEDEAVLRAFVERFGIRYPILRDPGAATAHRFGTYKYPETFLIDAGGQIVQRWVGAVDWGGAEVRAIISRALAERKG